MSDTTDRLGPVRNVAVVAKIGSPEAVRLASEVGEWLARRQIEVRFDSETSTALGKNNGLPRDALCKDLDLVLGSLVFVGASTSNSLARS